MIGGGKSDRQTGLIARQIANEVVNLQPKTAAESNKGRGLFETLGSAADAGVKHAVELGGQQVRKAMRRIHEDLTHVHF